MVLQRMIQTVLERNSNGFATLTHDSNGFTT